MRFSAAAGREAVSDGRPLIGAAKPRPDRHVEAEDRRTASKPAKRSRAAGERGDRPRARGA